MCAASSGRFFASLAAICASPSVSTCCASSIGALLVREASTTMVGSVVVKFVAAATAAVIHVIICPFNQILT